MKIIGKAPKFNGIKSPLIGEVFSEMNQVIKSKSKRMKRIGVSHAIFYEGWETNGKRISLWNPKVMMST